MSLETGGDAVASQSSEINSQPAAGQEQTNTQHSGGENTASQPAVTSTAQVVDDSFSQWFETSQTQMPMNLNQGFPVQPQQQQGMPPFMAQPQGMFMPQGQPFVPQPPQVQQPVVPQVEQVQPPVAPQSVEIDYNKLGEYLEDGNNVEFVKEINKVINQQTQSSIAEQKVEIEKALMASADETIQKKFEAQQIQQTVNTIVSGVQQELVKNNINLTPWARESLMNQVDQTVIPMYQNYQQTYNALMSTGQLNPQVFPVNKDGSPLSGVDFAIKYATQLATSQYAVKNVNTQQGTPNTMVRQTFHPVATGQGNPPQAVNDYSKMSDEEFQKIW